MVNNRKKTAASSKLPVAPPAKVATPSKVASTYTSKDSAVATTKKSISAEMPAKTPVIVPPKLIKTWAIFEITDYSTLKASDFARKKSPPRPVKKILREDHRKPPTTKWIMVKRKKANRVITRSSTRKHTGVKKVGFATDIEYEGDDHADESENEYIYKEVGLDEEEYHSEIEAGASDPRGRNKHVDQAIPSGIKLEAILKRYQDLNRDVAPSRLSEYQKRHPFTDPSVIVPEAICVTLLNDFNLLPPKIRQKIWEFALQEEQPRVVAITQHAGTYANTPSPDVYVSQSFGGIPALLEVNQETRAVAKKDYKLILDVVDCRPQYFNYRIDALHLWAVDPGFVEKIPLIKQDLLKVRQLAIHGTGLLGDADLYERLRHFPNLVALLMEEPSKTIGKDAKMIFNTKIDSGISRFISYVREKLVQKALGRKIKAAKAAKLKAARIAKARAEARKGIPMDAASTVSKQVKTHSSVGKSIAKTMTKDLHHRINKKSHTRAIVVNGKKLLKTVNCSTKSVIPRSIDDSTIIPETQATGDTTKPTADNSDNAFGNHDPMEVDTQVQNQESPASLSAPTLPKNNTAEPEVIPSITDKETGVIPEIESLIDNAIAEMPDVDIMINEAMADISFTQMPHVQIQPADVDAVPMRNGHTAAVGTGATKDCVEIESTQDADVTMVDGDVAVQGSAASVPSGLSGISAVELNEKTVTDRTCDAAEVNQSVSTMRSHIDVDGKEPDVIAKPAGTNITVEGCIDQIAIIKSAPANLSLVRVHNVARFRSLKVVLSTAEDILEVVLDASNWPLRVDMSKTSWKYNYAKPKARNLRYSGPSGREDPSKSEPPHKLEPVDPNDSDEAPTYDFAQSTNVEESDGQALATRAQAAQQSTVEGRIAGPATTQLVSDPQIDSLSGRSISAQTFPVQAPPAQSIANPSLPLQSLSAKKRAALPSSRPESNLSTSPTIASGSRSSGRSSSRRDLRGPPVSTEPAPLRRTSRRHAPSKPSPLNPESFNPESSSSASSKVKGQPQNGVFFTQAQKTGKIGISRKGSMYLAGGRGESVMAQATPASKYVSPYLRIFETPPAYVSPYAQVAPQTASYVSPYPQLNSNGSVGGGAIGSVDGTGSEFTGGAMPRDVGPVTGMSSVDYSGDLLNFYSGYQPGGQSGVTYADGSGENAGGYSGVSSAIATEEPHASSGPLPTPTRLDGESAIDPEGDTTVLDV
ncbi:uncharacterized protein RAG0_06447 [Rhynchosporium agropyri]|uniref:2EXR domain-containing protein n=1 Tax=Rhynchosporium agropyri TaxID=914238 RepID=A0A1E1KH43_9HELO|nr:uncharacterized protein RAG0_06447 [Rhynchosporium agropyri]